MCQLGSADYPGPVASLALEPCLVGKARQQNRGMRRFAKRRRTLAAFTAIMGRLGGTGSSVFKVQYRRLPEDPSPAVKRPRSCREDDPTAYCCCRCGHAQKLKVSSESFPWE